jgi:hypothetical protein
MSVKRKFPQPIPDSDVRDAITCIRSGKYKVESPAGSGKTSVCLKFLDSQRLHNSDNEVVYLSYTKSSVEDATSRVLKTYGVLNPNHLILTFNKFCLDVLKNNNICLPNQAELITWAVNSNFIAYGGSAHRQYKDIVQKCYLLMTSEASKPPRLKASGEIKVSGEFSSDCSYLEEYEEEYKNETPPAEYLEELGISEEEYFGVSEKKTKKEIPEDFEPFMSKCWTSRHSTTFDFHIAMLYYHVKFSKKISLKGYALIVDECQDIDPFKLALVQILDFEIKLMVGDPRQAIYSHDGTVNFFKDPYANEFTEMKLSTTFRFSQNVCDLIYGEGVVHSASSNQTEIVYYKALTEIPLIGSVLLESTNNNIAKLCLTLPSVALTRARVTQLKQQYRLWCLFNEQLIRHYQRMGRYGVDHRNHFIRSEYAKILKRRNEFMHVYASMNWQNVPVILEKIKNGGIKVVAEVSQANDYLLIDTIHSFKGREADVIIVSPNAHPDLLTHLDEADARDCLHHVAVTRACKVLCIPSIWNQLKILGDSFF